MEQFLVGQLFYREVVRLLRLSNTNKILLVTHSNVLTAMSSTGIRPNLEEKGKFKFIGFQKYKNCELVPYYWNEI